MIQATFGESTKAATEIFLRSEKQIGKEVRVLIWSKGRGVSATYSNNGVIFHKDNYQEVLDHLTTRGW